MKNNFYNTIKVRCKRTLNFLIVSKSFLLLFLLLPITSFSKSAVLPNKSMAAENGFLEDFINKTEENTTLVAAIPIRGKVTDPKGTPLAGVSVIEKGTRNGTVTDVNGTYKLSVAGKQSVLTFRFIGFGSQDLDVGNKTVINVSLVEANAQLNEVVVVAYGTQKKASVTGAISSVKGTELAQAPVANISNSIAGRVTGVVARQTGGGQPGNDNTTFSVRGINTISTATGTTNINNSPLIVVDGIIRNNINQIDPNSIESVTILKDAAAVAPYGLGGANGVVLITTKSGKTGAPTLTLNSFYGVQKPTYYPSVLNAQDYMKLRDEAYFNENPTGTNPPYAQTYIDNYLTNNATDPNKYPISNSRSLINFRAPEQSHNLELSGGSDKVRYYTNLGLFKQNGMFDPVTYTRYSYTLGLDASVTNTTRVSVSLKGAYEINTNIDAEQA
ncbi:MAG: SusC/RagA family TonB-linked outer membrane protein [Sphingobacteriaceae bacterium]|nr:MAG: SusC/RagA family TonB-linked outer membrane protein [Sphingobacteriaceae bacterium]